ncbi:MAG: hemerythrin domain-containing protein, partial [Acidimicrobiia bacterium]|nr:hemerythrin domain-containing protein [Acidimicrobiia bacterium]
MQASQPLRDEHRALLPEITALRAAADAVGTVVAGDCLESACRLLARHLLPHMAAEEAARDPRIDEPATRTKDANSTTGRADHDEIRRRVAGLEALRGRKDADAESELRAELYGLDAIVRLHLAKEEELYYPILDAHLGDSEAVDVVAAGAPGRGATVYCATGRTAGRRRAGWAV